MAAGGLRFRAIVLALFALVAIGAVVLIVWPSPAPIVSSQPNRFAVTSQAVRAALAVNWQGPIASGGGTRCWEAEDQAVEWRLCEAPMGQLMTVSASTPAFTRGVADTLTTVLHADEDATHVVWLDQLEASVEVRPCTTAGPLWRAVVDGRVVVGSIGRCPLE